MKKILIVVELLIVNVVANSTLYVGDKEARSFDKYPAKVKSLVEKSPNKIIVIGYYCANEKGEFELVEMDDVCKAKEGRSLASGDTKCFTLIESKVETE